MTRVPFLRPNLVKFADYQSYLTSIDESRIYSNYGPLNAQFEQRVIDEMFEGHGACVTVNNATTGLILAISQSRRDGRYAVMPSFTFPAAALAAQWAGLIPYFIDIDPDQWSQSKDAVDLAVAELGDEVAVVVPYATFGAPIELSYFESLHSVSGSIPVVIDAAASFGTRPSVEHFGKGFQGAIVFSFHATKAFGVGEGGLIYSGNLDLLAAIRDAGNFGFGPNRETETLGLNSKMSEYAAAIALATLEVFPRKIRRRIEIYDTYLEQLDRRGAFTNGWQVQSNIGAIPHQFFPILCPPHLGNSEIVKRLESSGIQCRTYFSPACHEQQQFADCPSDGLAVTIDLAKRILSLPLYEEMTALEVRRVVDSLP